MFYSYSLKISNIYIGFNWSYVTSNDNPKEFFNRVMTTGNFVNIKFKFIYIVLLQKSMREDPYKKI